MDLFGEIIEEKPPALESGTAAMPVVEEEGGLVAPRSMSFCLGHEAVEAEILEMFRSRRMPHGIIFSGIKGIGKATMAYRLARFLLKNDLAAPDMDMEAGDNVFRRVASGGHPDLFTVERIYDAAKNRYKAGVEVAEIRKVTPFLRLTASKDGGWRIVIIDDADTMNRSSQNALLKILEEPPENTVLILITHRLGALIPTVRSRSRVINFKPLETEIIRELLDRQEFDIAWQQMEMLADISDGSAGKAIEYIENGGLGNLEKILHLFQLYKQWNWEEIHVFADELSRSGQDRRLAGFQEIMIWIFSCLGRSKARSLPVANDFLDNQVFQDILKNDSLEQLLKICENLQEHFAKVTAANLDKRQAVIGAFSLIAE